MTGDKKFTFFCKELLEHDIRYSKIRIEGCATPEFMLSDFGGKSDRLILGQITKYTLMLPLLSPNSRVLDLCGGSGFGANIIGNSGHDVTSFDKKNTFKPYRPFVNNFIVGDLLEYPDLGKFDAITFIDVIEHFEKEEQPKILKYLFNSLKSGGICLIDTPMAKITRARNRHHKWELDWEDFYHLVNVEKWLHLRRFVIMYYNLGIHFYPMLVELEKNNNMLKYILDNGNTDQLILAYK
jgi:ubiquinone/menaquinone biosynthesis C-methylase UbiE